MVGNVCSPPAGLKLEPLHLHTGVNPIALRAAKTPVLSAVGLNLLTLDQ